MINIDDTQEIELVEHYIIELMQNNNKKILNLNLFVLGRQFIYSYNILNTYYLDKTLLSEKELALVPRLILLYTECGINLEIFNMTKEQLCDLLNIKYYTVEDKHE